MSPVELQIIGIPVSVDFDEDGMWTKEFTVLGDDDGVALHARILADTYHDEKIQTALEECLAGQRGESEMEAGLQLMRESGSYPRRGIGR